MSRVLVAGLGDTGVLTAIGLARHPELEVVAVSVRPGLVSGQELGLRLARPEEWARDYRIGFARFRGLDPVRVIHGEVTGIDVGEHTAAIRGEAGASSVEPWDVLVVATGVTNGFWRRPDLVSDAEVSAGLSRAHGRLAGAESILVIGGGASAVGSALQMALRWPDKAVSLAFPGEEALIAHHPRVWRAVRARLERAGVRLLPRHRAAVPPRAAGEITSGPVCWESETPPQSADAVLWAIGRVRPNAGWLPTEMLDDQGFVRVEPTLQVCDQPDVFAVGDVAATDPLRSSARNRADRLVVHNVRAHLAPGHQPLRAYRPPRRRWGSVLGAEPDGLRVFSPQGRCFRFPAWTIRPLLQPVIVRLGIYRGVRRR